MRSDIKSMKKRAQSLVEYGLILALVAIIAITALKYLGQKVNSAATTAGSQVETQANQAAEAYCESLTNADGVACTWSDNTCTCPPEK